MADTAQPTLKAVIVALKGDSGVSAFVGARVYSDVPPSETFPYVLIEIRSAPFAADDFSGQLHSVRVHCYSRQKSKKEPLLVRAAVHDVLDRREELLQLESGSLVQAQYSGLSDCIKEDGGKTWDAISEFELLVM